jgi:hypothetical protein
MKVDEDDQNLPDPLYQKELNQSKKEQKKSSLELYYFEHLQFFRQLEYQQHMYRKSLHHEWQ